MAKYLDSIGLATFWNKIKNYISNKHFAGSTSDGGTANKAASIPFGQVASTSTSTAFTATIDGITELRDGVCCYLKNGVVTSASGCTLNINNLGAKPIYQSISAAGVISSHYSINYTMLFVYNSTRVSGGCWDMVFGYDSGDSNTNKFYTLYPGTKTYTALYRYLILLTKDESYVLPVNTVDNSTATNKQLTTTEFNPFGQIYYYNSTTTRNANDILVSWTGVYEAMDLVDLRYAFNTGTTLTANKEVYIVATPKSNGKANLASSPISQTLPSTEDGKIYIYIGNAYDTYRIRFVECKRIYYYKDGAIRQWTNPVDNEIQLIDLTH